jgi:hypothetical protein
VLGSFCLALIGPPWQCVCRTANASVQDLGASDHRANLGAQSDSKEVSPVQGTPVLSGVVQSRGVQAYSELLLLLDQPARGLAHRFPMAMGDQVLLTIRFYLYGEQGIAVAPSSELQWSTWLAQLFPQETAG